MSGDPFEGFLDLTEQQKRWANSRPVQDPTTHHYLDDDEQFIALDRREFGEPLRVLIDDIATNPRGEVVGHGHRITLAGHPAKQRTLAVPLNPDDIPAPLLERLHP